MIGRVVSTKMKNTATVLVERTARDPLYKKTYKQSKKYLVDTSVEVKTGDIVEFIICKPVSKNKHWRVTKVLGENFVEIAESLLKKEADSIISEVMLEERGEEKVDQLTSELEDKKEKKIKPKVKKKGESS